MKPDAQNYRDENYPSLSNLLVSLETNNVDVQPVIAAYSNDFELIEPIENTQNEEYPIYRVLPESTVTFCCYLNTDSPSIGVQWFKGEERINFSTTPQPKFERLNDTCFHIFHTMFTMHSDEYSCVTQPLERKAMFVLHVINVPRILETASVVCNGRDAVISWDSIRVDRATVGQFNFQHETSYRVEYKSHNLFNAGNLIEGNNNDWTVYETDIMQFNAVGYLLIREIIVKSSVFTFILYDEIYYNTKFQIFRKDNADAKGLVKIFVPCDCLQ